MLEGEPLRRLGGGLGIFVTEFLGRARFLEQEGFVVEAGGGEDASVVSFFSGRVRVLSSFWAEAMAWSVASSISWAAAGVEDTRGLYVESSCFTHRLLLVPLIVGSVKALYSSWGEAVAL